MYVIPNKYTKKTEVIKNSRVHQQAIYSSMNPPSDDQDDRPSGLTAKGQQRRYATHQYTDRAEEILEPTNKTERDAMSLYYSCQVTGPFPFKLQILLRLVEMRGMQDIIGWQPHGRAFCIRKPTAFESGLMKNFFSQTQLTSFRRQLNLYDFKRITHGPDSGCYYHDMFMRGKPFHAYKIARTKVKGTKFRSTSSPDDEPDFYQMRSMSPCYDPSNDALMRMGGTDATSNHASVVSSSGTGIGNQNNHNPTPAAPASFSSGPRTGNIQTGNIDTTDLLAAVASASTNVASGRVGATNASNTSALLQEAASLLKHPSSKNTGNARNNNNNPNTNQFTNQIAAALGMSGDLGSMLGTIGGMNSSSLQQQPQSQHPQLDTSQLLALLSNGNTGAASIAPPASASRSNDFSGLSGNNNRALPANLANLFVNNNVSSSPPTNQMQTGDCQMQLLSSLLGGAPSVSNSNTSNPSLNANSIASLLGPSAPSSAPVASNDINGLLAALSGGGNDTRGNGGMDMLRESLLQSAQGARMQQQHQERRHSNMDVSSLLNLASGYNTLANDAKSVARGGLGTSNSTMNRNGTSPGGGRAPGEDFSALLGTLLSNQQQQHQQQQEQQQQQQQKMSSNILGGGNDGDLNGLLGILLSQQHQLQQQQQLQQAHAQQLPNPSVAGRGSGDLGEIFSTLISQQRQQQQQQQQLPSGNIGGRGSDLSSLLGNILPHQQFQQQQQQAQQQRQGNSGNLDILRALSNNPGLVSSSSRTDANDAAALLGLSALAKNSNHQNNEKFSKQHQQLGGAGAGNISSIASTQSSVYGRRSSSIGSSQSASKQKAEV